MLRGRGERLSAQCLPQSAVDPMASERGAKSKWATADGIAHRDLFAVLIEGDPFAVTDASGETSS